MNVYTCIDHDGLWPVGVASVVVAETADEARKLLQAELDSRNLGDEEFTLQPLDLSKPGAYVLHDGNY